MDMPEVTDRRAEDELEQALVLIEDLQRQNAALLEENGSLRQTAADLRLSIAQRDRTISDLEMRCESRGIIQQQTSPHQTEEELRVAIEELQVMAEELEMANEKLRLTAA